jgi:hypothetical protein
MLLGSHLKKTLQKVRYLRINKSQKIVKPKRMFTKLNDKIRQKKRKHLNKKSPHRASLLKKL